MLNRNSKNKTKQSQNNNKQEKKSQTNSIILPLNSTEKPENAPIFFLHYFMAVFHSQTGMAILGNLISSFNY